MKNSLTGLFSLGFSLVFIVLGTISPASSNQDIYYAPDGIEVSLGRKPLIGPSGEGTTMVCEVTAQCGTIKQVEARITASSDLKSSQTVINLDSISSGTSRTFEFAVASGALPVGSSGSWVQVNVTYAPDYEALLQVVASDTATYPHSATRRRLLDELANAKQLLEKRDGVARFRFFPAPE